jgi:serine/threonine protein kinase
MMTRRTASAVGGAFSRWCRGTCCPVAMRFSTASAEAEWESSTRPTTASWEIAIQVASGLQAIHGLGIVHRDLKTPNLMRDPRAYVRLMDFGVAKDLGAQRAGSSGATQTGHVVGTPEYMSPEWVVQPNRYPPRRSERPLQDRRRLARQRDAPTGCRVHVLIGARRTLQRIAVCQRLAPH